jgi:hypothetical protein
MSEGVIIALIMAGFSLIGSVVTAVVMYRSKKLSNNPHPCKDHAEKLKALDEKLDNACERLSKIEGRLNGMR